MAILKINIPFCYHLPIVYIKKFQIHDLQCQIDQLNNEKNYCLKEIQHFQSIQTNFLFEKENVLKQLKDAQLNIEDLNKEMEENKQTSEEKSLEIFTLKNKLRETEDKLEFFTKEKETLSISLEACNIQLQFLQTECAKKHTSDSEQCEEHLKTIEEFKRSLQETHIELSSVNSERYFIQRLCNDLKVALKSQINQNQVNNDYFKIKHLSQNHVYFIVDTEAKY